MALAISSLPVPVSPVIRIVERLLATCATRSSRRSIRSLLPMIFGKAVALFQRALELGIFAFETPLGNHAVDLDQQLFVVPGLRKIIVCAQFQRVYGGFYRAIGRDHEDGSFAVALAHVASKRPCRSGPASSDRAGPDRRRATRSCASPRSRSRPDRRL